MPISLISMTNRPKKIKKSKKKKFGATNTVFSPNYIYRSFMMMSIVYSFYRTEENVIHDVIGCSCEILPVYQC